MEKNMVPTKFSILFHRSLTKILQKIITLIITVEKKTNQHLKSHQSKKYSSMLRFELVPSASQPCCPIHCPMGTIGNSDKCQ